MGPEIHEENTREWPLESLPLFENATVGDLAIVLSKDDTLFRYRVNKDILRGLSCRFMKDLDQAKESFGVPPNAKVQYLLVLEDSTGHCTPLLKAHPIVDFAEILGDAGDEAGSIDATMKTESDDSSLSRSSQYEDLQQKDFVLAYHRMFKILHHDRSIRPQVKPVFEEAVKQAQAFALVAKEYDMLPIAGPHIENIIHGYRGRVAVAIMEDPPKWLNLAILLECAPWYEEAMTHMIGAHPIRPGNWTPLSELNIPESVLCIIATRSKMIQRLVDHVNGNLLLAVMRKGKGDESQPISLFRDYEQWVVASLWRDWLTEQLRGVRCILRDGSHRNDPHKIGTLYRLLSKGGDAYLPSRDIQNDLTESVADHAWDDVQEDLDFFKNFASNEVAALSHNALELKIEEHANEVGYLTCAKVTEDDAPWKHRTQDSQQA